MNSAHITSVLQQPTSLEVNTSRLEQISQGEGVPAAGKADFGELLSQALDKVNGLQSEAGDMRERFEMGDRSVSVAEVMIAGQKASLAFDATVQVRNKLVQAYQDIMNMPV